MIITVFCDACNDIIYYKNEYGDPQIDEWDNADDNFQRSYRTAKKICDTHEHTTTLTVDAEHVEVTLSGDLVRKYSRIG